MTATAPARRRTTAPPPPAPRPPAPRRQPPRRYNAVWVAGTQVGYDIHAQMPAAGAPCRDLGTVSSECTDLLEEDTQAHALLEGWGEGWVLFTDDMGNPAGPSAHLYREQAPPAVEELEAQISQCAGLLALHPGPYLARAAGDLAARALATGGETDLCQFVWALPREVAAKLLAALAAEATVWKGDGL